MQVQRVTATEFSSVACLWLMKNVRWNFNDENCSNTKHKDSGPERDMIQDVRVINLIHLDYVGRT
jgi:hypothetical protein